ncbi:hypothetical protein H0V99_01930 [Candidatus Saccharibacteria bacterium]|nr:hypothetical protein [Candidatus Saccharibacteria bacterium]
MNITSDYLVAILDVAQIVPENKGPLLLPGTKDEPLLWYIIAGVVTVFSLLLVLVRSFRRRRHHYKNR